MLAEWQCPLVTLSLCIYANMAVVVGISKPSQRVQEVNAKQLNPRHGAGATQSLRRRPRHAAYGGTARTGSTLATFTPSSQDRTRSDARTRRSPTPPLPCSARPLQQTHRGAS
ncbi:unnamed protein product [Arctogadus glacialis]